MNIILADCKTKERRALGWLLKQDPELNVVAETAETDSLLTQTQATLPDLVVLNWELPGLEATDLLRALRCLGHPLKVVAFSDRAEACQEAAAAGVDAFVSKEEPVEELLKTVRTVGELSPCLLG